MIKEVEVEKVVEVERVVEVPVEREVVREIVREVPVDRVVEVEKLVGMREEEVEAMKQALQVQAEQERQRLLEHSRGLIDPAEPLAGDAEIDQRLQSLRMAIADGLPQQIE